MNPDSMHKAVELMQLGFDIDEIQEYISASSGLADIRNELLAVKDALEEVHEAKSNPGSKYVDYKSGWYQDLNGNLYQYDGVVWDVVPGRESGELEFLG